MFDDPLLITGLPRSGTSTVDGILGELGLWLGKTVTDGNPANRKDFFENVSLRENVNKNILRKLECDPLRVGKLPDLENLPHISGFSRAVETMIKAEGYDGHSSWGFKDTKLTLLWPCWREAFPNARWVVVHRPRHLVIQSYLKTHFMNQHSVEEQFWEVFCDAYEARLSVLKAKLSGVVEIDS